MHGRGVADVSDLLLHSPHAWAQSVFLTLLHPGVSTSCAIFSPLTHSNTFCLSLPPSPLSRGLSCSAGSTTQTALIGGKPVSPPVTLTVTVTASNR